MARTKFPSPGAYIDGGTGPSKPAPATDGAARGGRDLDPRILWLNSLEGTVRDERSVVTQEMRRNMALYEDKHWESFGSSRRAPWKLSGVLNYCAWTADRKAALLADNKPKVTYVTPRREDDWQCEIMNAAFDEVYEQEHLQAKIEAASKLSVIRKVSYLKTGYDPAARHGKGGIVVQLVDGINVFVNKEAMSLHDAEIVLQVYTEQHGVVLEKWKKLTGKKTIFSGGSTENEDEDDPANQAGAESRIQPAQSYVDPNGVTQHTAPYASPQNEGDLTRDGKRCLIREVWTRPRGPKYEREIKGLKFTVSGQIVTERKLIEFEDGHIEPLQTVVTEGNVVYELPMSTVHLMQWASDNIGGIKILSVEDTLEVVLETVRVPLYPTGRRMIAVGNEIAEDGCNPFSHGDIPFIKFQENTSPKYYPRTTIDRIATLQDCLNRIFSMIFDAAHLTANPIWRLPLNSDLADEEVTNAPGAIQREDPNSLKMGKREAGPNMPAYVMQYMQFIIAQIREMGGMTDTATGAKGAKGQISAETQSMFQEAAGVSFRPSLRLVEQSIVELGNQVRGLVGQFYTDQRYLELKQESGVERHVSFIGVRLTADMRMRAKAGSLMPTSPSARLNYVTNLMNTPAMDVPELLRNLEEVGIIESAAVLLKRLTKERNTPALQWLIPSLQPAGGKQKKKPKPNGGKSSRGSTPQGASSRM